MKKYISECLGTFFLVFAGTGAIIANDVYGGAVGHVGIALSFGLVVMAAIYAFGESSGAHINPAVTLGFLALKKISMKDSLLYIVFQCVGAILASLFLKFIFPTHQLLGTTVPSVSYLGAFLYEFLLTFLLMVVILSVATGAKEKGITAAMAIGGTVALEALFGGLVTGASMNPARSIGPAIVSGHFDALWIYVVACTSGALAGTVTCKYLHGDNCCGGGC